MTTTTVSIETVTVTFRCTNPFSQIHGKEIGSIDIPVSRETLAGTASIYCGKCREYHRQTFRIG